MPQRSTTLRRRTARPGSLAAGVFLHLLGCHRAPTDRADAGGPERAVTAAAASVAPLGGGATELDASFVSAAAALETAHVTTGKLRPLAEGPSRSGEMVDVPAGSFASGSTPGDDGRDPTTEPALVPVKLDAYSMDALPFPNDPSAPSRLGASRDEAARLCGERGARLCTELEWERACKGPDGDAFVSGGAWNPACEKEPSRCASGFGVRALGTVREMTASTFAGEGADGAPVVRGGVGVAQRRCASRSSASTGASGETAFRCCKSAPNAAPNTPKVASIESRPGFKKANIEPEKLGKIFAQIPELARIGTDIRYFTEGDIRQIQGRSGASHEGIQFLTTPVMWSPEPGAEILVATGRGKSTSFVVALWVLPDETYRFASSFLMLNDLSPVSLAFDPKHRKELRWTSCWGCAGEQGSVSYRFEEHRVVVVQ